MTDGNPLQRQRDGPETAAWLLLGGAWDGMSMDGGGSVTMVKADAFNNPVDLNHSSYIPNPGASASWAVISAFTPSPCPASSTT